MQISMGRCAPAMIYFVWCSVFFMALKLGIILWTLHLCSHCFRLFWMILLKNAMGRKFHHNYSQSEATVAAATRQDNSRISGDTLAIPRRYPKMEKRWKKEPLAGKFRTYKNAGKNINVPNHVFQNTSWTQHAPTSRNLSPQLNATKQVNALSFQMGCMIYYYMLNYISNCSDLFIKCEIIWIELESCVWMKSFLNRIIRHFDMCFYNS